MKLASLQTKVQEKFCIETRPDACGLVIFGATGDLAQRKLFPSLLHLRRTGLLPKNFYAVGSGRSPMSDDAFRENVRASLEKYGPSSLEGVDLNEFLAGFYYQAVDYSNSENYKSLHARLCELDKKHNTRNNRVFYLSLPPSVYVSVVRNLGAAGLAKQNCEEHGWSRLVIEKPFGRDFATAQSLNAEIRKIFSEEQTYRIDHYLGKETVQSIMVLRFANILFEPIWNRQYVDHVQITAAEELGVGHRAGYYEEAGVLRDMFQNHLLQLLCITAMEPPPSFHADRVRDEKAQVLRAIRPIGYGTVDQNVVRGQYGPSADGKTPGYRQEKGVSPDSITETYTAMRLFVDNWRWQGVPFYIRSGKCMAKRLTEIAVTFKRVPHLIFKPLTSEDMTPNVLLIRIQPEEGVSLTFETKHPGPKLCMSTVTMDFNYETAFGESPEAYERLFLDCMAGDQTLFNRVDWVDLSWTFLGPILEKWKKPPEGADAFPNYAAGSWGPAAADGLLTPHGHSWRNPE